MIESIFPQELIHALGWTLLHALWLMGVLVLLLRMLGQLVYLQRLKSYGATLFPEVWHQRIGELEARLGLHRPVRYLLSYRVTSPMIFGWLRPVLLFPKPLFENQAAIAGLLIKRGAKVNFMNKEGWTALMEAVENQSLRMVDLLLKAGANASANAGNGATALSLARESGNTEIIRKLER